MTMIYHVLKSSEVHSLLYEISVCRRDVFMNSWINIVVYFDFFFGDAPIPHPTTHLVGVEKKNVIFKWEKKTCRDKRESRSDCPLGVLDDEC